MESGLLDLARPAVVQVGECDLVLSAHGVANENFVDVIELVPVLVLLVGIAVQWLELGATRDGDVECLGSKEGLLVEEVGAVLVGHIAQKLVCEPVEVGHHLER